MHAAVGDRLHINSRTVGAGQQEAEIVEVRGPDGRPPYLVRFTRGQESLMFPGSDCLVEHH